jgi:hypothetical protein
VVLLQIQITADNYEAFNFLLKCFFLSNRYEAGEVYRTQFLGHKFLDTNFAYKKVHPVSDGAGLPQSHRAIWNVWGSSVLWKCGNVLPKDTISIVIKIGDYKTGMATGANVVRR